MSSSQRPVIDVASLAGYPAPGDQTENFPVVQKSLTVRISGKSLTIYSQQTNATGTLTVLLLHGQAFTSNNWVEISTLQLLASWGFRAIAIDLPGYGKSKDVSLSGISRADFLLSVIGTLGGSAPVIVSPSMSGSFSLPYLFSEPALSTQRAKAYIPVAPVMTDQFQDKYAVSQLPTLIVYGERDENLGYSSRDNLVLLPKSQIAVIPDAGHACYMNQPALFHNLLYSFLSQLAE